MKSTFNKALGTALVTAAVASAPTFGAAAAETPNLFNGHSTCESAQEAFTRAYGAKATYGEIQVKTTAGKTCTLTFGQKDFIPVPTPSLDKSSCAAAQDSFKKILTGEGKATITTTIAGKPCTLSK